MYVKYIHGLYQFRFSTADFAPFLVASATTAVTPLYSSQSQSHIATDGQSVNQSWCRVHIWGSWPDIYCCLTITVLLLWNALSDERTGLSFVRVILSPLYSCPLITPRHGPHGKHRFLLSRLCLLVRYLAMNVLFLSAYASGMCLPCCCLAMGIWITIGTVLFTYIFQSKYARPKSNLCDVQDFLTKLDS
jgi:hypothetical protein